jgi:hypothetical protein
MEKEESVDRLSVVCRLLMDERVSGLRREVEELRLKLFWKDHSVQKLNEAMAEANHAWDNSPKCDCCNCLVAGRTDDDWVADDSKPCKFVPWFDEMFTVSGLTYGYVLDTSSHSDHISDSWNSVWDTDSHIVKLHTMSGDWSAFTYGSRLWKAKTVKDTELKKLEKLFQLLGSVNNES